MGSFSSGLEETSRTVFFPSLVVNFQLRLDEGMDVPSGAVTPEDLGELPLEPIPRTQLPLEPIPRTQLPLEPIPRTQLPLEPIPRTQPVVLEAGTDDLSQIVGIVPHSCSVELPGYRQAGTFNIEIAFRDLPLDPRVIRALGVAIHLDTVAATDFADGMASIVLFGDVGTTERRKSIIETTPENILIAGLADSIVTEHANGIATVRIEGRDLRGILLDTPISPKILTKIDVTQDIQKVVAFIVNRLHPAGAGIVVDVKADEWPGGVIPSPATLDDVTRVNLDALGEGLRAQAKGEAQEVSYWDLITNYCFLVGGVPYFVGSVLRIRPARTIFDTRDAERTFDPNFPTPFKDGEDRSVKAPVSAEPETFKFRRFVFGRDVQRLSFERKLGGVKVPVIEAVSYDTSGEPRGKGRLLKAQFPPQGEDAKRTTSVGASGKAPQTDVIRIKVPGIKNKKRLLEIATDIYQEIGRQELGGAVETKNLSSFGGSNQDPDLIRLRPGDAIEIRVDASGLGSFPPPIAPLTDQEAFSFEQAVKEVASRVGNEKLARVLVAVNRGEVAGLTKQFRVANVRYDWDADSGVAIAFDFQNFVEARFGEGIRAEADTGVAFT